MTVAALEKFVQNTKSDREPWDPLYQEVADFLIPRKSSFTTPHVKGNRKENQIYDDTGPWALEQFGNGIHAYLTSPQSRWFDLQIVGDEYKKNSDVLLWKEEVTNILYREFNSSISSFHPTMQEVYTDTGAFGYGIAYSEWSEADDGVLFQARFPGECYLYEDLYGRLRGITRCYTLKAVAFVEAFGLDKLSLDDQTKYREGNLQKEFQIDHIVLPTTHPVMMDMGIAERYKYGSIRLCGDCPDKIVQEGGFKSFPYHTARWAKRAGDVYSTSPSISAMPSIRRANLINLDIMKIANRWADPPTQGPDDETLSPYDLSPGAQNFYRPGTTDRIEAITGVLGDPSWAERLLENTQASIQRQYFIEAFLTTADSNGQNVKATFVNQRKDERFRQLSAMLSRIERELLSSVVERNYELCEDHGKIPEPPVDGVALEIEFLSPIVRAQRAEQLDGLYPLMELSGIGAQFDPSVMDVFEWDNIIRDSGEKIYALPASWFKTREAIEAKKQNDQAMQELQAGSEIAGNLGSAVKDVADADLNSLR